MDEQPTLRMPGSAALIAIGWIAVVIALDGLISLESGLEVQAMHDAGAFVVPAALLVAVLALFARLVIGVRPARATALVLPIECGVIAYLAIVLVGAAAYAIERHAAADALLYLGAAALSAFTLVPAIAAVAAGLVYVLIVRATSAGASRPRWPWERPHDEP